MGGTLWISTAYMNGTTLVRNTTKKNETTASDQPKEQTQFPIS